MGRKNKRRSVEIASGGAAAPTVGNDPESRATDEDASRKSSSKGGGRSGAESGKRRATAFDAFRENAEAIVIAVILAVIIRHFAVEAFEIPTGSMAPTLYGIHAWTDCPNCRTEYNVALRTDRHTNDQLQVNYQRARVYDGRCGNNECGVTLHRTAAQAQEIVCRACDTQFPPTTGGKLRDAAVKTFEARCPICAFTYRELIEDTNYTGGHKILVTKFSYVTGEPKRWNVIVFAFDQWKNYIKRLAGLPGERIDIWDADLYINGQIERKYRHPFIQNVLWVKTSDSDVREARLRNHPLAWRERAPENSGRKDGESKLVEWNQAAKSWSVNALGEVAVLEYSREFDNFYSYNQIDTYGVSPPGAQVGDKKVEFEVQPLSSRSHPTRPRLGDAWVGAEIRDGDFTFRLRIPVGAPDASRPAVLERMENHNGEQPNPLRAAHQASPQRITAAIALPVDKAARVAFENVDDRAAVFVRFDNQPIDDDDEPVLEIEYTSFPAGADFESNVPMPAYADDAHSIQLLAVDSQAKFSHINVYRDMYYISEWDPGVRGIESSIQLGEHEYFALGDNGPSSADSRFWGVVPHDNLMGKAFAVFWPAWPANFQCKFIR